MSDEKLREVSGRARAEGRRDHDVRDRFDAALTDSSRLDRRLEKRTGSGTLAAGARSHRPCIARSPWTSTGLTAGWPAQPRLKKKLSCAGVRADCSTRGGVTAAGRTGGRLVSRRTEALGASWIDIGDLRCCASGRDAAVLAGVRRPTRPKAGEQRRRRVGRRRRNRCRARLGGKRQPGRPVGQHRHRRPVSRGARRQPQQRRRTAMAMRRERAVGNRMAVHRGLRIGATCGARMRRRLHLPCRPGPAHASCAMSRLRGAPTGAVRRSWNPALQGCPALSAAASVNAPKRNLAGSPPAGAACSLRGARRGSARCRPARRPRRPSSPAPRR
jgi:hypothetical protein